MASKPALGARWFHTAKASSKRRATAVLSWLDCSSTAARTTLAQVGFKRRI